MSTLTSASTIAPTARVPAHLTIAPQLSTGTPPSRTSLCWQPNIAGEGSSPADRHEGESDACNGEERVRLADQRVGGDPGRKEP